MQGIALQSGWETFLLAAPFVGMLLVGIFRLDEIATNPDRGRHNRLPGNDQNGRMLLSDPDRRPWANSPGSAHSAQID